MTKKLSYGNCPFCDSESGFPSAWGMSPEGWAILRRKHEEGHLQERDGDKCICPSPDEFYLKRCPIHGEREGEGYPVQHLAEWCECDCHTKGSDSPKCSKCTPHKREGDRISEAYTNGFRDGSESREERNGRKNTPVRIGTAKIASSHCDVCLAEKGWIHLYEECTPPQQTKKCPYCVGECLHTKENYLPPKQTDEWEDKVKIIITEWIFRLDKLGELKNFVNRKDGFWTFECPDISDFIRTHFIEKKKVRENITKRIENCNKDSNCEHTLYNLLSSLQLTEDKE